MYIRLVEDDLILSLSLKRIDMKSLLSIIFAMTVLFACKTDQKEVLKSPVALSVNHDPALAPFYHGVASGDPLQDRVIIWTKATPEYHQAVNVVWKMSDQPDMSNILFDGQELTDSLTYYTVKVDVVGLDAGKTYYYEFEALGKKSVIGTTKTLPVNAVDEVAIGVVSCSNYEWGYFNAYEQLAKKDVDVVIHLGDYIYEYQTGGYGDTTIGRIVDPTHEIVSLEDYRLRYSQYRLDRDLQAVHSAHPFICIWDDHEVSNNSYTLGAENHQDNEGDYLARKEIAKKVYYEWIPIRENDTHKHYRSFNFGDLTKLIMLDERLEGRTKPADDYESISDDQKMLGAVQMSWLEKELATKEQTWKVIGNQVIFADLDVSAVYPESKVNLDAWDGYPSEKKELISYLSDNNIDNAVFVTGDTHCSWAFDVKNSNGQNVALEFGTPGVTSANYDEYTSVDTAMFTEQIFMKTNKHLKYVDLRNHGYAILTLTADGGNVAWYYIDNIRTDESAEKLGKSINFKNNKMVE